MFRNRGPHNNLRCSTERSLRVEKQTQSRTDNRPGEQNRSQLPTVNLSLPNNQVQGNHHVELQFHCQRPVHLIHVIHTQEALQHRRVNQGLRNRNMASGVSVDEIHQSRYRQRKPIGRVDTRKTRNRELQCRPALDGAEQNHETRNDEKELDTQLAKGDVIGRRSSPRIVLRSGNTQVINHHGNSSQAAEPVQLPETPGSDEVLIKDVTLPSFYGLRLGHRCRSYSHFSRRSRAVKKPSPLLMWPCQISGMKDAFGASSRSCLPSAAQSTSPSPT